MSLFKVKHLQEVQKINKIKLTLPTPAVTPWPCCVYRDCIETVCTCVCFDTMEARMGRKSVAVATLLAHSVKVAMRRQRMTAMAQGGMEWSGVI